MPRYYDGLDADGYAINEPWRQPYVHGSEADAGEFRPVTLGSTLARVLERATAASEACVAADSPIETILGAAIILCFNNADKPLKLCAPDERHNAGRGLLLIPQFDWSYYRSDWAIYNPKTTGALLIECDGKEFHSSADQIAHDQKKDAAAHDRGYLVMRFTGSQIHRNADGCANKIFQLVYGGAK